jgi:glycosyltransferase involved in cell wall biosynthesis
LRFCCKRIVYDFDDALFVRDFSRWSYLVRHSWRVIAGSRYGLEKAAALNPHSIQIPSSVSHGFAEFDHERELVEKDSKCICIGWLGGRGTRRYLKHVIEPLHRLSEANLPFELLIAGVDRTDDITNWFKGMKITQIPLYNHADIPTILARIDIGIMPLDQTEWELGKCAMKTILYMAAGIATVSSDYGEVKYVVNDGFNGLLASTVEDWTEKMRLLIENPGLRSTLGQAGRRTVEQYYTSETAFGLLTEHVFKVGIGNNPPLTYNHSSG